MAAGGESESRYVTWRREKELSQTPKNNHLNLWRLDLLDLRDLLDLWYLLDLLDLWYLFDLGPVCPPSSPSLDRVVWTVAFTDLNYRHLSVVNTHQTEHVLKTSVTARALPVFLFLTPEATAVS